jgi:hypothetical protein
MRTMSEDPFVMEDPSIETGPGPRPFSEIPPLWLKIFKMDQDFFASELPRASYIGVALSTVAVSGAVVLIALVASLAFKLIRSVGLVPSVLFGLLVAVAGFYASVGITFLCARILGGNGSFKGQVYLQSLYSVPIGIAQCAVVFVPLVGGPLGILGTLYSILLGVNAVKVSHKLAMNKATAAVLAPILLVVVLLIVLFVRVFFFPGDTPFML